MKWSKGQEEEDEELKRGVKERAGIRVRGAEILGETAEVRERRRKC